MGSSWFRGSGDNGITHSTAGVVLFNNCSFYGESGDGVNVTNTGVTMVDCNWDSITGLGSITLGLGDRAGRDPQFVTLATSTQIDNERVLTGTANQLTITDNGAGGTVVLSVPVDFIIPTTITIPNTGLHLLDTNASHDLIIAPGSDLTADRTLTLATGDADRTLTLSGSPTLGDWFDQSVKQAASPAFAGLTLTGFSGALSATAGVVTAATLTVPLGGTGATTLTDHGILLGSGVGAITALGSATNGQIPIGSTGADPVLATISGTANQVSVANGAGSITLSTPQDIATSSNVQFGQAGIGVAPDSRYVVNIDGNNIRLQISDAGGETALVQVTHPGIVITSKLGNTSFPYNSGLMFASADPDLTTTNPKILAAIIPIAAENITADNDGGTHLAFYTFPNSSSVDAFPAERMRIDQSGKIAMGTPNPQGRFHIAGEVDDQQLIVQAHSTQTANIVEIQDSNSALLLSVSGTGDVDHQENAITNFDQIAMKSAVEATISAGEITTTEGHIKVDTENDDPNDDLDTINSSTSGEILFLLPADSARTVRIRNGIGNIFLKHQVDSSSFSFSSPAGAGAVTRYAGGGWYDFATSDTTLDEGSLTQTFGSANVSYAAHASIVTRAVGTVDTGTVSIVVSGTSVDDEGNRQASDEETILADITDAGASTYFETAKKWIGQITFTLTETVGDPTAYTIDFNYGLSKYEDFGNQDFTVTGLQVAGAAGASDSNFNMILFLHSPAGWTYDAGPGFVPGGTQLANMNTDHSTEQNLANGEPFAWKRTDLNTDVTGNNGEGVVFRIDTSAARAIESLSGVIWVHTAPAFSYLSNTKQHLIFMKHGPNWLEL